MINILKACLALCYSFFPGWIALWTDNSGMKTKALKSNFCSTDLYMLFKILFPTMDTEALNINVTSILHRIRQKVETFLYLNVIPTKLEPVMYYQDLI